MDRYRIVQKLGAGGMGVVYEAEDLRLRRRVALKFLAPELSRHPQLVAQMEREARAASALNHPNICTIYDIDESDGELFIVMELLEGRTVGALAGGKPLAVGTAIDIALQLTHALDAAHRNGIVHRDIKPANVFVTLDGTAKILDFGLAKVVAMPLDGAGFALPPSVEVLEPGMSTSVLIGTPGYVSPERLRGETADARSDLFSLGCLLYEMTTGRRAFAGECVRTILDNVLDATPPPASTLNGSIPGPLERIIQKLLEKDPQRRYSSASQVSVDLKALGAAPIARPRRWPGAAGVAAAAVTGIALAAWIASRPAPHIGAAQRLLIGTFENRTSDPVFDGTLQRALTIALEQSPYVQTVPDARVRETLQMMQRPPEETPAPQLWRELCERLDARTLVTGWIAPLGTAYIIGVDATGCSGDVLAARQVQADSREQVLQAVQRAADGLRRSFGEPRQSLNGYDRPIQQATTASLEALRAFSAADPLIQTGQERDAITLLERAVQLDPAFALAHQRIATLYRNLGVYDRANQHAQQAYGLRTRTTEREKLIIEQRYHREVTGDWAQLEDTLKVLKYTYPSDTLAPINLGVLYAVQGRLEDATAQARAALALDPAERLAYENLSLYLIRAGKLREAAAVLEEQKRAGVETTQLHRYAWTIAEMTSQALTAPAELAWLRRHDPEASRGVDQDQALFHGQFARAREIAEARASKDIERNLHETAALRLTKLAAAHALAGRGREAAELCRHAFTLARTARVFEDASFALGLIGGGDEALNHARRELSGLMVFRRIWIPIDEAAHALGHGHPDEALRAIAPAAPYEFGEEAFFYPAYLRVVANLQLGRAGQALADAQKIIDRRGVDPFSVVWVLAHLQQARAAAKTGDVSLSRTRYEEFLKLWQDADRDLTVVSDARRELAGINK